VCGASDGQGLVLVDNAVVVIKLEEFGLARNGLRQRQLHDGQLHTGGNIELPLLRLRHHHVLKVDAVGVVGTALDVKAKGGSLVPGDWLLACKEAR